MPYYSDGMPWFTIRNSREVILEFYAWYHGLQDEGAGIKFMHLQFYDVLRPGGAPDYYLIVHPMTDESAVMFKLKYAGQLIPDNQWYSAQKKYYKTNVIASPPG